MRQTVLWIVGEPGVGKTTLARALIPKDAQLVPKPKWTVAEHVAAVGHYTGETFDGGDTVPYNGAREALEFWDKSIGPSVKLTLLDGDRFSTLGCAEFVGLAPVRLACVLLYAPEGVAAQRRNARGSRQNETWIKGRATKACKFWALFNPSGQLRLDTTRPFLELMADVEEFLRCG